MRFAKRWNIAAVAAGAVVLGLAGSAVPAGAALSGHNAAAPRITQSGGVSPEAALGTPQLNKTGKALEVVRQLVQCGGTMYAVGRFTSINQGSTDYARNNIFSFSATAPYTITSWAPDVNGQVNSIAFNGTNCADAYIGGEFTSVNGTAVENIAEIDTTTGNVVPTFGHSANYEVWTIQPVNGHLLVGGDFRYINGTKDPFMASLNPTTGKDDGFLNLDISGDYQYCAKGGKPCTKAHHSEVYNQQLSHGGTLDLVEGHFTSVGGLPRQQIFMLNLGGSTATVTGLDLTRVGRQRPERLPLLPVLALRGVLHQDRGLVARRLHGLHRHHRLPPGAELADGLTPRTGLCDCRRGVPGHPDLGDAQLGRVLRVRLLLHRSARTARGVRRRASPLGGQLRRVRPGRDRAPPPTLACRG